MPDREMWSNRHTILSVCYKWYCLQDTSFIHFLWNIFIDIFISKRIFSCMKHSYIHYRQTELDKKTDKVSNLQTWQTDKFGLTDTYYCLSVTNNTVYRIQLSNSFFRNIFQDIFTSERNFSCMKHTLIYMTDRQICTNREIICHSYKYDRQTNLV